MTSEVTPFKGVPGGTAERESETAVAPRVSEFPILPLDRPRSIPDTFLLASVRHGALRVARPFNVAIWREDEHVVAHATEVNEFGWGTTLSEAVTDLQRALAALFYTLSSEEEERLGPELRAARAMLLTKIRRA